MSVEEFESWKETLEVMRDFPNLEKDIKKAEREYKRGNHLTLEDVLFKEGLQPLLPAYLGNPFVVRTETWALVIGEMQA